MTFHFTFVGAHATRPSFDVNNVYCDLHTNRLQHIATTSMFLGRVLVRMPFAPTKTMLNGVCNDLRIIPSTARQPALGLNHAAFPLTIRSWLEISVQ